MMTSADELMLPSATCIPTLPNQKQDETRPKVFSEEDEGFLTAGNPITEVDVKFCTAQEISNGLLNGNSLIFDSRKATDYQSGNLGNSFSLPFDQGWSDLAIYKNWD